MKRVFLFAAALVAIASCSKTETNFVGQPDEIAFKSIATKANSTLDAGVKMGVHAQLQDKNSVYFTNAIFAKNADNTYWSGEPARYWPNTGTLDFTVYAPYQEATMENGKITCTVADQVDFLYGEQVYKGITKQTQAFPVNLKHAKAAINFTGTADVTGIYQINSIVLSQVTKTGTLTVDYNAIPVLKWTNDEVADHTFTGDVALTAEAQAIASQLLVVPSEQTSFTVNYSMKSTPDDKSYVECPAYTVSLRGKWEAGKKYTYNVKFNGQEITFEPTVTDWAEGSNTEHSVN